MVTTVLPLVDSYLENHSDPHFAAFDADGTLWANDVGEAFFQYQIDHCQIEALKECDPWAHYLNLKKHHPPTAYLWLAQICKNYTLNDIEQWAIDAAYKNKPQLFANQKALITELQKRNVKIYVVSASVEWAVAGALKVTGLENVTALGVKTKVKARLITDEQEGFVTWREGKKQALLEKTKNVNPFLSCGNTMGDQHLLEISQKIKIAIQSQAKNSPHKFLLEDEQNLLKLAHKNNWLTFDFSSEYSH